jgi:ribokinase
MIPKIGPRIVVVGDIVTDVIATVDGPIVAASDTPARITTTGGGAGANTAAWLAYAGARVTLCGVVGADPAGAARIAELRAAGVRCVIRRAPGAGTGSIVVISDGRERTMLADRGANLALAPADVDRALGGAGSRVHVHVSGYALLDAASRPAAAHALARRPGWTTSVDAASAGPLRGVGDFRALVPATDVLLANVDEARVLVGGTGGPAELAAALASWARVAVVKAGADGAAAASDQDEPVWVPAVPAEAVDATGAGDAFAAGFLVAWLGGADLAGSLAAGARLGAEAVGRVGARPPVRGRRR